MKEKTVEKITKILKEHEDELKKRYNVKELGLFGSYVKRKEKERSDIDVLVEFEKPVDFFAFLELEEYLSELINIKVDLVMKKTLKPNIGKCILEEVINV